MVNASHTKYNPGISFPLWCQCCRIHTHTYICIHTPILFCPSFIASFWAVSFLVKEQESCCNYSLIHRNVQTNRSFWSGPLSQCGSGSGRAQEARSSFLWTECLEWSHASTPLTLKVPVDQSLNFRTDNRMLPGRIDACSSSKSRLVWHYTKRVTFFHRILKAAQDMTQHNIIYLNNITFIY